MKKLLFAISILMISATGFSAIRCGDDANVPVCPPNNNKICPANNVACPTGTHKCDRTGAGALKRDEVLCTSTGPNLPSGCNCIDACVNTVVTDCVTQEIHLDNCTNSPQYQWCHIGSPSNAQNNVRHCLNLNGIESAHGLNDNGLGHTSDHYASQLEIDNFCGFVPEVCPPPRVTAPSGLCRCPIEGQIYNPLTNTCVEPPCTLGVFEQYNELQQCVCIPGYTRNLVGVCTQSSDPDPDCEDCDTLSGAADFRLDIAAGGIASDMYVCEIGFLGHHCVNEYDCGGDYIHYVDSENGIDEIIKYPGTFTNSNKNVVSGIADIFLNSVNAGSSWYVRYCLDIDRKVVGTPDDDTFYGKLNSFVTYTTGIDNHYYDNVGLEVNAYQGCREHSAVGAMLDFLLAPENKVDNRKVTSDTVIEQALPEQCLTFDGTNRTDCAWLVVYQETIPCLRELFRDLPGTEGAIRSGMVKTSVEYELELNCEEFGE